MRKSLIMFAVATLCIAAPAAGQDKPAAVRAAIDSTTAEFEAAMNAGRFGDIGGFYADDAIVLPTGAPAAKGRAAVTAFWNGMSGMKVSDTKFTIDQLELHGDVAIEVGGYTMTVTPPGASAGTTDKGKYLVVWKRQADGSWKIYRDMFSSNSAPAPQ